MESTAPFGLMCLLPGIPWLLARMLVLAARVRRQALPKAGLPLLIVASRSTMQRFCEVHSLRVPYATQRDLMPCKSSPLHARDKTVTQTSAARHASSYKWQQLGHLGHENCRPSPKLGHSKFQETGLRALGHNRTPGEGDTAGVRQRDSVGDFQDQGHRFWQLPMVGNGEALY